MTNSKIPYWDDLPDLELYLDQILLMVNQLVESYDDRVEKGLTASMVNNYVKHKHVEKPVKKKYQKQQVARLIAITFLKNVFSIQEISQTLNVLHETMSSQEMYDNFVASMREEDTRLTSEIIQTACQSLKLYYKTRRLVLDLEGGETDATDA